MSSHGTPLTVDQFAQLVSTVVKALPRDLYPEVVSRWHMGGSLLKEELYRVLSRREGGGTFLVAVDFSRSFNDMLAESGCVLVDSHITPANFPVKGEGRRISEVELIRLGERLNTKSVNIELDAMGFYDEGLPTLLAFAARNRYWSGDYSIVARASVWDAPSGVRYVPELVSEGGKRCLRLHSLLSDCSENCCFLVRHRTRS